MSGLVLAGPSNISITTTINKLIAILVIKVLFNCLF
jgi:hypothetical protein